MSTDESIKRPDEFVEDLELPEEESENVRGGLRFRGALKDTGAIELESFSF